ncbi:MAG: DUF58 domain-containing protein [Parachlamydiaceae bacterium]|nr:DUF58 domain-containing protein [Parachlamydiaceae bacterium]
MPNLDESLFEKIRRIQIVSSHLAQDVLAGAYRSVFKGRGMEFEEVREYQAGDDIRSIDWNVTARMSHPYVKNFREERDLTVMLLVDISASSRFGTAKISKSELIAELGAVLAFSAIKNNDRVGLILFSDIIEHYVPPRKGTRHVLRVIRELLAFQPKNRGTSLKVALDYLGRVQSRSCICFLISDFLVDEYAHEAALIAKRHELIALCITDPAERRFPDVGLLSVCDLESGQEMLVDSSQKHLQEHFQKQTSDRIQNHQHSMQKVGAGFVYIQSDQSYIAALKRFFTLRKRRQA